MRINAFQPVYIPSLRFKGLHTPDAQTLFVFDIDGTFLHGDVNARKALIEKIKPSATGLQNLLVFATGRTKAGFEKLQRLHPGEIPTPDFLITSNGQFVHSKQGETLVVDSSWDSTLKKTSQFDITRVQAAVNTLAKESKYRLTCNGESAESLAQLRPIDGEFADSKIAYYSWDDTDQYFPKYFIAPDVDIDALQKEIQQALPEMTLKFIVNRYPKTIMDKCDETLRLQTKGVRSHPDGSVTAMFVCAADKADAIDYVRKKQAIALNETVMAGNGHNDISMLRLAEQGAYFVCVGNAEADLKEAARHLKTAFFPKNEGTSGILDGITQIIASLKH